MMVSDTIIDKYNFLFQIICSAYLKKLIDFIFDFINARKTITINITYIYSGLYMNL